MQPTAAAPRPGPAAAKRRRRKEAAAKMKKTKKTNKIVKQLRPRAEAAAERAAVEEEAAAAEEAARRARHLKALSRTSGAERELEELVFGDSLNVEEGELLQRLAGPQRVGLGARRAAPAPRPSLRPGERGEAALSAVPSRGRCSLRVLAPARSPPPVRGWADVAPSVVSSSVLRGGEVSGEAPVIRKRKMKQKVNSCLKSQPGWMKTTRLRKRKFKFAGRSSVSRLRVTVSAFSLNDLCVWCVSFPLASI